VDINSEQLKKRAAFGIGCPTLLTDAQIVALKTLENIVALLKLFSKPFSARKIATLN
jgi:hypothetical protein